MSALPGATSTRRRPLRVAVGGVSHETNTFSPVTTTQDDFRRRLFLTGDGLLEQSRVGRSTLSGIVEAAETAGVTLLPTLLAAAPPAGVVDGAAFAALSGVLLDRIRTHRLGPWGLDGVILSLHGAMVAEGHPDAEGALLGRLRDDLGPDIPVVVVLDSHANLTAAMAESADLFLSYSTYPHVDLHERGQAAVEHLTDMIRTGTRPATALRRVPILAPLPAQRTDGDTPMRNLADRAHRLQAQPGVRSISITPGFPYADVAEAGMAVIVACDNMGHAESIAAEIADAAWSGRDAFRSDSVSPEAALDRLRGTTGTGPVVLADIADNPGAGAPGDGTNLLRCMLARGAADAVIGALPDPEAVAAAVAAGIGRRVRLRLGGKVDPRGGLPLDLTCRVRAITDGVFVNGGPMGRAGVTRMGRAVLLAVDGVEIVVCERPVQAIDPNLFRAVGVEPADRAIVAVKSSVHFRAAFAPLAREIIEVEAGGLSSSDLASFPYRNVRRPVWPLDDGGSVLVEGPDEAAAAGYNSPV